MFLNSFSVLFVPKSYENISPNILIVHTKNYIFAYNVSIVQFNIIFSHILMLVKDKKVETFLV